MARAKRWNEVFITIEDFNKELARVKATRQIVFENCANIYLKTDNWHGFKYKAYVWDTGRGTIHLAYRMGCKSFNFVTSVDGQDKERAGREIVSGGRSWCVANHYNHITPNRPELAKILPTVSGLLYYNPRHQNTWIKAWHYDMNSAYAHILMHYDFPDLENPLGPGIVEEGQIGFNIDFTRLIRSGLAVNRYNLVPSPYKTFAEKEFAQVKELRAKGKKEKAKKYKSMLTNFVGYLKHKRPIDRNYIVLCSTEIIQMYVDALGDDALFANTDCIVCSKPIDEYIDIGTECGQFKVEHAGVNFEYSGNNSHWEGEKPKIRGVSKGLLRESDRVAGIISREFPFILDTEVLQIIQNEKYEEKPKEKTNFAERYQEELSRKRRENQESIFL